MIYCINKLDGVKVYATFDGEPYDGSIVNMGVKNPDGSICYIIGVRKDIRSRIGKRPEVYIVVTFGLGYRVESPRIDVAVEPYPGRFTHHVLISRM